MIEEIVKHWWHIPVIMVLVLLYGILLNYAFFRPVQRVLEERQKRIAEAGGLSDQSREAFKARFKEYELAVLEAHRRATHIKEQARSEALAYRAEVLAKAKAQVEGELSKKEAVLQSDLATVRRELETQVPALAREVASKVLGREVAG